MIWFHSAAVQFPRARPHAKRRCRWVGVKGSIHNRRRDPKCPSARRLRIVREDTEPPVKVLLVPGYGPMKHLDVRVHFLRWGWSSRRLIVRVQYFVRGGFVGHRSRASSKHLSPHLPVDGVSFLRGQKGLRCSCKMHVWVSGSPKISTAAGSGYVTVS
ncbi:uncharacterized protein TNCV_946801 [Trichonephila clavipes]|nr:uncharacterized protein TNCV_946801 [Trichonephila clavipes]